MSVDGRTVWRLKSEFYFFDPARKKWIAPVGTQSDGASIPQWALSAVGSGFDENFLDAAVVHDAYCSEFNKEGASYHQESWEDVHAMFYDALIALGTPKPKASLMYAAVYLGGPRWTMRATDGPENSFAIMASVSEDLREAQLVECKRWIESRFSSNAEPTREEIAAWMKASEVDLRMGKVRGWSAPPAGAASPN